MAKRKVSKQSKRRLVTFGIPSIIAIGYFVVTFFGYSYSYMTLKKEEINLNQELTRLQEQKANLKIEITKLNDPNYVARYAKEKYLYSGNGEYVIKMDENGQTTTQVAQKQDYTVYIIVGACIIFLGTVIIIKKKKR